jgi:hypothetical protein
VDIAPQIIAQIHLNAHLLKLALLLTELILALSFNVIPIPIVLHKVAKTVFALRVLMTQTVLSGYLAILMLIMERAVNKFHATPMTSVGQTSALSTITVLISALLAFKVTEA